MQLSRCRLTWCTQILPFVPAQPNPPFFKKLNFHIKLQHQARQPILDPRFQQSSIIIALELVDKTHQHQASDKEIWYPSFNLEWSPLSRPYREIWPFWYEGQKQRILSTLLCNKRAGEIRLNLSKNRFINFMGPRSYLTDPKIFWLLEHGHWGMFFDKGGD